MTCIRGNYYDAGAVPGISGEHTTPRVPSTSHVWYGASNYAVPDPNVDGHRQRRHERGLERGDRVGRKSGVGTFLSIFLLIPSHTAREHTYKSAP